MVQDVEWFALVSTLVGGLIGIGSALMVERTKWQRQVSQDDLKSRRQLYADFLADLGITRDAIRAIARGFHPTAISRRQAAEEAFMAADLYSRRFQVAISAPEPVVAQATATYRALRSMRDVVAERHDQKSPEYATAKAAFEAALSELLTRMRADLGARPWR